MTVRHSDVFGSSHIYVRAKSVQSFVRKGNWDPIEHQGEYNNITIMQLNRQLLLFLVMASVYVQQTELYTFSILLLCQDFHLQRIIAKNNQQQSHPLHSRGHCLTLSLYQNLKDFSGSCETLQRSRHKTMIPPEYVALSFIVFSFLCP